MGLTTFLCISDAMAAGSTKYEWRSVSRNDTAPVFVQRLMRTRNRATESTYGEKNANVEARSVA